MKRWAEINALFQQALDLPPGERDAVLREIRAGDPELEGAVRALLEADRAAEHFLEVPLLEKPRLRPAGTGRAPEDSDPAEPHAEPPGRRIGPYRLLRQIGQGGMSTVYLARRDDEFQRQVALKLIRRDMESPESERRLRGERKILAHLDHPYVARLYDGGTTDEGLPYFVMELIDGEPIDRYCDQRRLSVRERLELFLKILMAVHYAHQNLIVHRDLKPSNILVAADGTPKLLDFGIAKILNAELAAAEGEEATATWMRMLTPSYASPEQLRGAQITTASDVYSLGALLFKLLTGTLPYRLEGRAPAEMAQWLAESEPATPSLILAELPAEEREAAAHARRAMPAELGQSLTGDLDAIVRKALQPTAQRRYGSVEQLSQDLQRHLNGFPVEAGPDTLGYRAAKFLRRHRKAVAGGALAAILLTLVIGLLVVQNLRVARERDRVLRERDTTAGVLAFTERILALADPAVARGEEWTVAEVLSRGDELIQDELAGEPAIASQLHGTIGRILLGLGKTAEAIPHLERSLELHRELHGGLSMEVARASAELAEAQVDDGEFTRGQELAWQAVELYRRLGKAEDPELVAAYNTFVSGLCAEGDFASAEAGSSEALALARLLEPNDPQRARAMQNRAIVLSRAGDGAGAEALHREVLAIRRATLGEPHPDVASALGTLAATLHQQKKYAEAERYYHLTLAQQRLLLGEEHPDLAPTLNNLAALHQQAEQWAQAEEAYRQAIALFPEDHFTHLRLRIELAGLLATTGKNDASEQMLRHDLAFWRPKVPPGNTLVAWAESTLGDTLTSRGRYAEAETLLTRSLPLIRERRGPNDPYTQKALRRLVRLYEAQGRAVDALSYREQLDAS